jgi:hypothetical protein
MDADEIRILIRQKLQDGRLPLNQHAQFLGRTARYAMGATNPSRSRS